MLAIRTFFLATVIMGSVVGEARNIVPSSQSAEALRQAVAAKVAGMLRGARDVIGKLEAVDTTLPAMRANEPVEAPVPKEVMYMAKRLALERKRSIVDLSAEFTAGELKAYVKERADELRSMNEELEEFLKESGIEGKLTTSQITSFLHDKDYHMLKPQLTNFINSAAVEADVSKLEKILKINTEKLEKMAEIEAIKGVTQQRQALADFEATIVAQDFEEIVGIIELSEHTYTIVKLLQQENNSLWRSNVAINVEAVLSTKMEDLLAEYFISFSIRELNTLQFILQNKLFDGFSGHRELSHEEFEQYAAQEMKQYMGKIFTEAIESFWADK